MAIYGRKHFWKVVAKIFHFLAVWLSAEPVLRYMANGGTAVMLRSAIITFEIYFSSLGITSITDDKSTAEFSFIELQRLIHTTLPWIGAIFAGTYAALYSRFSAQWSYLAALYNQLMATCVNYEKDSDHLDNPHMVYWQAAFIEDAEDLHLATKGQFAPVLHQMLSDARIRDAYLKNTDGSKKRLAKLDREISEKVGQKIIIATPP